MVIAPSLYISRTLDGISAWAFNVLPSILPFIFFTKVLSSLGTIERATARLPVPTNKMFGAPKVSFYVFLMSLISGYPVGAKMTADLYLSGQITRAEAFRMTSFCSTSGPMFIIGAVGVGMLKSATAGYIIFIAHALAAFLNGFLYRKVKAEELPKSAAEAKAQSADIGNIILDSVLSILSVGGIIAIFFVVITSISPILNLLPAPLAAILGGLVEITKGCIDISAAVPLRTAIIASSFVISFGGLSTLLQSLTMLGKLKMPVRLFLLEKVTHALLATAIAAILVVII